MTWCGIEEPLQANSQLLALDEHSGVLRCAEFDEPRLCRYSFTKLGAGQWCRLVTALVRQFDGIPRWALIWKHEESGDFRMRSRIRVSRLRRQGFSTQVSEGVGIGVLSFDGVEADMFRPAGTAFHPAGDGALVLLAGEGDLEELLASQAGSPTMAGAGANSCLSPSREFLSWLAGVPMRLLYLSRDQLERPGLVVLSQSALDVGSLASGGIVERCETGARAPTVWTEASVPAPQASFPG
jgi:hypothetical protein